MSVTIEQVLRWDVDALEAAGASLHSSASHVVEIEAALPHSGGPGGRGGSQSWLASSWRSPSAVTAQGAASDINKNLKSLSELLDLASEAAYRAAGKINTAQQELRSARGQVGTNDYMTMHPDGTVTLPASYGEFNPAGDTSDHTWERNAANQVQSSLQSALRRAEEADKQLCDYLRYYFEGVELPAASTVSSVVSTVLDIMPFLGAIKAVIEGISGEDLVTHEVMSDDQRALGIFFAAAGFGVGVGIAHVANRATSGSVDVVARTTATTAMAPSIAVGRATPVTPSVSETVRATPTAPVTTRLTPAERLAIEEQYRLPTTNGTVLPDGGYVSHQGSNLTPAQVQTVDDAMVAAARHEATNTPRLLDATQSTPGSFQGLDHSLKGEESVRRKIADEAAQMGTTGFDRALARLNDLVRYSYVTDASDYVSSVSSVSRNLESQGFELVRETNFWVSSKKPYQAINSTWFDPRTNQVFEVQFHTPESWAADLETHWAYEATRVDGISPEDIAIVRNYERAAYLDVAVPDGVESLDLLDLVNTQRPQHE